MLHARPDIVAHLSRLRLEIADGQRTLTTLEDRLKLIAAMRTRERNSPPRTTETAVIP